MKNCIRKLVAGATLVVSLGGGGALLASNATHLIASTADAGQPGTGQKPCMDHVILCALS